MKATRKVLAALLATASASLAEVRVESVPEMGLQPQVVSTGDGTVHLVYLKGDPKACDVHYVHRVHGSKDWSAPVTVNSEPRSAIAMGTIRGAQVATGQDGSLHVVWNGPNVKKGDVHFAPLLYTRLVSGASKFERQRDLGAGKPGLDGGASVAANARGEVFVVWHGRENADQGDERERVVFVRRSPDNGATFSGPAIANTDFRGVCACCSVRAFAGPDGGLTVLYRAARDLTRRDLTLLASPDGLKFSARPLDAWRVPTCPMSSSAILATPGAPRLAWETDGRIFTQRADADGSKRVPVSGPNAKHPSLAVNARGETLVVWIAGSGWARGGSVAWTVLGGDDGPSAAKGQAGQVPAWSFAAAYAEPGGDFVILR